MKGKDRLTHLISGGKFDLVSELIAIFVYWLWGAVTFADASSIASQYLNFTFTIPTTPGSNAFSNGSISYTLVSLITAYHNSDFSSSYVDGRQMEDTINLAHSDGYLLDSEQSTLINLGWE